MPNITIKKIILPLMTFFILIHFIVINDAFAQTKETTNDKDNQPKISIPIDMDKVMVREAARVKDELTEQAKSLFERTPLGWDIKTIEHIYGTVVSIPFKLPSLINHLRQQSQVLGFVGTLIILTFITAIVYSFIGQSRVLELIEKEMKPLKKKLPEAAYPFVISILKVVVAALMPLILALIFLLINAMITYEASWFLFTGRMLLLWAIGALFIGILRESLTQNLFKVTQRYGRRIFRLSQWTILYVMASIIIVWIAEAFNIRTDVVSLIKFTMSISIVVVLFLFVLNKRAFLSLIPDLPYHSFRGFIRFLDRCYHPLIVISLIAALLGCFGYRQFGKSVLTKIWSAAGVYLLLVLFYHSAHELLRKWAEKKRVEDESAYLLYRSLRMLLLYSLITFGVFYLSNLLGIFNPITQVMSFPIFTLGEKTVSFWVILKSATFLVAFVFSTQLLIAYMDYKAYPSLGIDPGLGYALNTFIKYALFSIGFLFSLRIMGIDFRLLIVFAGAIGIGIGLGMQSIAANIISGFTIIFGGKIRKGDWIEMNGTLGQVTDIYLRATRLRSRDNIEYLVPNSEMISTMVVNYSLASPLVRINLPVGVSYNSDPDLVKNILMKVADKESLVSKEMPSTVRFVGYGESSIDFELLFWIDIRTTSRRHVRSNLLFTIFSELSKNNIEIPYPQRDIHIKSSHFGIKENEKITLD